MDVVVKHGFVARGEGEISALVGERLMLVEQSSGEWWRVRNREGESGWIPSTYLFRLGAEDIDDEKTRPPARSDEGDSVNEVCIAVHRFTATHADEISFKVGEAIEVLQKKEDGWWKGRVHGLGWTGWFPASYVEPKKKPRKKKKVQRDGSTNSRNSNSEDIQRSELDPEHSVSKGKESHLASKTIATERLRTLYPYTANNDDELSFSENEYLYRTKDDNIKSELQGWWKVKNVEGRVGLIPANYVEVDVGIDVVAFRAVACHTYSSEGGEELSFLEGQILDILQSDSDWWYARDGETGTSGYVPSNYLQPLAAADVSLGEDQTFAPSSIPPATSKTESDSSLNLVGGSSNLPKPSHWINDNSLRNSRRIPLGPFSLKDWYFGPMSRRECETVFAKYGSEAQDGTFLVRDGGKHALDFVLSVKSADRVRHFRVAIDNGNFSLVPTTTLKSMDSLIDYYKKIHLFTEANGQKLLLRDVLYLKSGD